MIFLYTYYHSHAALHSFGGESGVAWRTLERHERFPLKDKWQRSVGWAAAARAAVAATIVDGCDAVMWQRRDRDRRVCATSEGGVGESSVG